MKVYTLLSKEFYQSYMHLMKIVGVLGILCYIGLATLFVVGGVKPPYLFFLLLLFAFPFSLIAITPFLPASAKLFGQKISIGQEQVYIYTHKTELLRAYSFETLIVSPKKVLFHSYRGALVEQNCLVLHTNPNLFDNNSDPPRFAELQKTEDTFVVQNPEVIALLEQIFLMEQK